MENFRQLYQSTSQDEKLSFLEQALNNSENLQNQFLSYFRETIENESVHITDFNDRVEQNAINFESELAEFDFSEYYYEEDWEYDRYSDGNQDVAVDELEAFILARFVKLNQLLAYGKLNEMIAEHLALLTACEDAEIDDPNEVVGDVQGILLNCYNKKTDELIAQINRTVLHSDVITEVIGNVCNCYLHGYSTHCDSLKYDEILNHLILKDDSIVKYVWRLFEDEPDLKGIFPGTCVEAAKKIDPAGQRWLIEAENLIAFSENVTQQLLEYYKSIDLQAFLRVGKKAFSYYPDEVADTILNVADDTLDPQFSRKVLDYMLFTRWNIKYYKRLVKFLNPDEKSILIKSIEQSHYRNLFIDVLEHEKMFDQILDLAKTNFNVLSDYHMYFKPLLEIFPSECFRIIISRIRIDLESNPDRRIYNTVAQALSFLMGNSTLSGPVRAFVSELFLQYNRRPALKDELRKTGLFG